MDPLELLTRAPLPLLARVRVPRDLESVTRVGEETLRGTGVTREARERVWRAVRALYRTGAHPAVQVCIRRRGRVVLHRAIGHAAGNAPDDPPEVAKVPLELDTPFTLFSASKAVTAMLIHKLDERGALHLDDRVCTYIPAFRGDGKEWITIRHLLAHRAGIPSLPPEAMRLDWLIDPERIVARIAEERPRSRPGQVLAYHAVSGGFVLGEVARVAGGGDLNTLLEREIARPLGLRWMRYGTRPGEEGRVARNAVTGPPPPPPIGLLLRRALGASLREVVAMSNDPRFLRGVVPAANVVCTAGELAAFYQCLLDEGAGPEGRVFEPRTVHHATAEHAYRELDLTLGVPLRYGLGLMLGDEPVGLFGLHTPRAFGHIGFTNIFGWADPEREIAVAILTSGKPILSLHAIRLLELLLAVGAAFPRQRRRR